MGDDQAELFPANTPTLSADAMAAQIVAWQNAGKAVSLVVRRALLDQAHAIDLAIAARRATQISGASRVLLELLQGFHLVDDAPPPADDPFDRFLAVVGGAGDTSTS